LLVHGIIFAELKKYVDSKLGHGSWSSLLKEAGLDGRIFLPIEAYPDKDIVALVKAAGKITKQPADALLQDFGEFIVPDLLKMYGSLLRKGWTTVDVIESTEETIHRAVRSRIPGAKPPQLRCERRSPEEVVVHYASARRMCAFAKGLVKGLAHHYGESVYIRESSCMHKGDKECRIAVRARPGRIRPANSPTSRPPSER
jgi:predicted hydrocarbon binding protein